MTVTVYSTENCPFCKKVKEWLTAHKVEFKSIDVGKDANAAQEMIKKSGQTGVPVVDANGTIITGFKEEELKKALNIK